MSFNDEGYTMVYALILVFVWLGTCFWFWHGFEQIGTPGHVCFANHTCRSDVRCVVGVDVEDGICIKGDSK